MERAIFEHEQGQATHSHVSSNSWPWNDSGSVSVVTSHDLVALLEHGKARHTLSSVGLENNAGEFD